MSEPMPSSGVRHTAHFNANEKQSRVSSSTNANANTDSSLSVPNPPGSQPLTGTPSDSHTNGTDATRVEALTQADLVPECSRCDPGKAPHGLPRLHFHFHWWKVVLYFVFLGLCNLAIPCIVFYPIREYAQRVDLRTNIGISSATLGLSSCFDAPFRLYKLVRHRKQCGPLGDDVWWHGDFFMWTYTFALFCFAFPLAIAPALTPVFIDFFLMSTAMLVLPFGVVLLFTLFEFKSPIWISSDPPGSRFKPGMFYVIEDICAVDFGEGRPFREAIRERYRLSPHFRKLMLHLTYYWIVATVVYFGATAAVTWGSNTLNFAFAYVLGQLFIWMILAAFGCWAVIHRGLKREKRWWNEEGGEKAVLEDRMEGGDASYQTENGGEEERRNTMEKPPRETSAA